MSGKLVPFDLKTEAPITLKEAVKQIPSPRTDSGTIAIVTIRKWLLEGVKIDGHTVQLQGVRMGRSLITSRESVLRFVAATSGPVAPILPPQPATAMRTEPANRKPLKNGKRFAKIHSNKRRVAANH